MKAYAKGALKSKTVWFNGVLLAALPAMQLAQDFLPILKELLTEDTYKTVGIIAVFANIVLRFLTSENLKHK